MKIVYPKNEGEIRKYSEMKNVNLLMNPHLINVKDSVHFRRGGLNQVVCKFLSENNILIGFSLGDVLSPSCVNIFHKKFNIVYIN